ncbi:hypothetical protein ETB97_009192 [Aspergillus alliaceus]|uniref:Shelterin complex subunit TPP1/Est3 domain-containing protein n=1 Tax=Petromyces alliaceus TaxID=209559 RepID=A0A8H6A8Q2_PETAA|nr:hypothetical protein ETB97_009192 [Aspergillus burnettii]
MSAWVAPLVERTLSLYIKGQVEGLQLEDDGSNLRFASRSPQYTIVVDWRESEGRNVATLTDFNTQIEAVLAKESLEELQKESPGRSLNRNATLNHYIQLLDYEIVLEYAMSAPKIHLYVKNFTIARNKGKYKGAPQGKLIKKNARIRGLIGKAFDFIKSQATRHTASTPESYCFDGSLKTQTNEGSGKHASQQFLQSQAQTSFKSITGLSSMVPPSPSKRGSVSSNALLGYLGSHNKAADSGLLVNKEHKTAAMSLSHGFSGITEVRGSNGHAAKSTSEIPVVEGTLLSTSGSPLEPILAAQHNSPTALEGPYDADHKASAQEAGIRTTKGRDLKPENLTTGHTVGEKHTSPPQTFPKKLVLGTERSSNGSGLSHTDPWHDMTRIRTRDVRIPKNQVALLEQHTRQWVPPDNPSSIRGYVPPGLLAQWNRIALQKSRLDQQRVSKSLVSEQAESPEPLPEISTPTPQTDVESDEEPVTSQWSESSPERVSRPLRELPVDSSPVTRGPAKKGKGLHVTRSDIAREDQQQGDDGTVLVSKIQQGDQAMSGAREDFDVSIADMPSENDRLANKQQIFEPDHNDTRASELGCQAHSDAESEDSIMDTSVPCPLGGSQLSNFTNQSEQGLISSGSSLPIIRGHVQVLETPIANLNHLRSTSLGQNKAVLEAKHPEQLSSQVAKSSSQSRIFNTYASNDGDTKDTKTTDISRTNDDEESNDNEILETQPSNGDWLVQDATPNSHTALVFDSSAPKAHDSNASIPMSTLESHDSKPFPSHDEVLSSMGFEGNEPDIELSQGVARGTPVEQSQISPLKRAASDIGLEEPPSSKRYKFMRSVNTNMSTIGVHRSAPVVVSRREDYIRYSAEHLEAQRVYEKFRNDYPSYSGDFLHFKKLCAMLQTLRDKGSLQRSFLWDSFVIMHLEDYPHYLEQCLSSETKSLVYEDYFTLHFSKPTHKKRSLTAEGIKVVAAQNVLTSRSDASVSPFRRQNATETSFTASLVDKFSNFHAHSLGPATQQSAQSDTNVDRMSFTMSSPTPHTKTLLRTPADVHNPQVGEHDIEAKKQLPEAAAEQLAAEEQQVETERQHSDTEEQVSETEEQLHMEMTTQLSTLRDLANDKESVIVESETNSEEYELMNETHEIASIELGDEEPSTAPDAPLSDNETGAPSEAESPNENWFLSLRHLFPTVPNWCDGPNTPFKRWAQADQNAFVERKSRRNWARVPIDDKGVPQRPYDSNPE